MISHWYLQSKIEKKKRMLLNPVTPAIRIFDKQDLGTMKAEKWCGL